MEGLAGFEPHRDQALAIAQLADAGAADGVQGDAPQAPAGPGHVNLEAAACGKPTIGGRSGGVPEAIGENETGLLVSGRQWLDYVSYCAGMPMAVIRVWPDETVQAAIVEAASVFEVALADRMAAYRNALSADGARLVATERRIEQEMIGL